MVTKFYNGRIDIPLFLADFSTDYYLKRGGGVRTPNFLLTLYVNGFDLKFTLSLNNKKKNPAYRGHKYLNVCQIYHNAKKSRNLKKTTNVKCYVSHIIYHLSPVRTIKEIKKKF